MAQLFNPGQLGGKIQPAVLHGIKKGLFAKAVAGAEQTALLVVPQGKGKHAVKAGQTVRPPYAVAFKNDFRVGTGLKLSAKGGQLFLEFGIIVYFTVEGDGHLAIGAVHGLAAAGKVDDGEPPVSKADRAAAPLSFTVGAAMGHAIGHGLDPLPGFGSERRGVNLANARYTAHFCFQIV